MLLFFRVLLHVSVFLTAAGLLDWLFYAETVVTHSCVNLNHLAQLSQFNPKRQSVRLCCFTIILSVINILIKTSSSSSLIASSLLLLFFKSL